MIYNIEYFIFIKINLIFVLGITYDIIRLHYRRFLGIHALYRFILNIEKIIKLNSINLIYIRKYVCTWY